MKKLQNITSIFQVTKQKTMLHCTLCETTNLVTRYSAYNFIYSIHISVYNFNYNRPFLK